MQRRNFLRNTALAGGITISSFTIENCNPDKKQSTSNSLADKVKFAMLSTQRASWEQGIAAQALMEMGDNDLLLMLAKEAVLRQAPDGRLASVASQNNVTDTASNGEPLLYAYTLTGDNYYKDAALKMLYYLEFLAPKTSSGILLHLTDAPDVWADSIYMAPPFLSAIGKHELAVKQALGMINFLQDHGTKLLSHMWNDEKKVFTRKDFWGVGNGWTVAGLNRIINSLPKSMKQEKQQLIVKSKEIIDACIRFMRDDALFHNVLDDKNSFVETNLSQMLVYSIFTGVKSGWLESSYLESANKMRKAAHLQVDNLGFVQGVCGSPDFNHAGTACEGQAFYLLMETSYQKLNKS